MDTRTKLIIAGASTLVGVGAIIGLAIKANKKSKKAGKPTSTAKTTHFDEEESRIDKVVEEMNNAESNLSNAVEGLNSEMNDLPASDDEPHIETNEPSDESPSGDSKRPEIDE